MTMISGAIRDGGIVGIARPDISHSLGLEFVDCLSVDSGFENWLMLQ